MRHSSLLLSIADADGLLIIKIVPTARSVAARPKTKDIVSLVETKDTKILKTLFFKVISQRNSKLLTHFLWEYWIKLGEKMKECWGGNFYIEKSALERIPGVQVKLPTMDAGDPCKHSTRIGHRKPKDSWRSLRRTSRDLRGNFYPVRSYGNVVEHQ
jgi:hypothetical protein